MWRLALAGVVLALATGCPGDAQEDGGVDAGDAGADAGRKDAGFDAGVDAGFDAGPPDVCGPLIVEDGGMTLEVDGGPGFVPRWAFARPVFVFPDGGTNKTVIEAFLTSEDVSGFCGGDAGYFAPDEFRVVGITFRNGGISYDERVYVGKPAGGIVNGEFNGFLGKNDAGVFWPERTANSLAGKARLTHEATGKLTGAFNMRLRDLPDGGELCLRATLLAKWCPK